MWSDLGEAMRMARNGRWPVGCENIVARIVWLSRAAGTWTPWENIGYPMLLAGTWQGITAAAGIEMPAPGEEDLDRIRAWMDGQRLAVRGEGTRRTS